MIFPLCSELFTDDEGNLLKKGDTVRFPKLADTLEEIAFNGSHMSFYTGDLADIIAAEIRNATPGNQTIEFITIKKEKKRKMNKKRRKKNR